MRLVVLLSLLLLQSGCTTMLIRQTEDEPYVRAACVRIEQPVRPDGTRRIWIDCEDGQRRKATWHPSWNQVVRDKPTPTTLQDLMLRGRRKPVATRLIPTVSEIPTRDGLYFLRTNDWPGGWKRPEDALIVIEDGEVVSVATGVYHPKAVMRWIDWALMVDVAIWPISVPAGLLIFHLTKDEPEAEESPTQETGETA